MGNANAAKGTRFEHVVKRDLEERGYFCMRSPASKSPIDVLAVDSSDVLFVQCKTNGRLDPAEWNVLYELAMKHGGTPLLAFKPVRGGLTYHRLIGRKDAALTRWAPIDEWPGVTVEKAAA